MASLSRWSVAAVLGCAVVALAYVPPRGARPSGRPAFFMQAPRSTPAREHAQRLADEWRTADATIGLLAARQVLGQLLRSVDRSGSSLVVMTDSAGILTAPPRIVDSAAHLAWNQLGLGETKIAVALVIQLAVVTPRRARPVAEEGLAAYLGPDSTDRTTCTAMVPAGVYWTRYFRGELHERQRLTFDALVETMKANFGPCAFYASFGTPSRSVRGWLVAHEWDLALALDSGLPRQQGSLFGGSYVLYPWYWDAVYSLPPDAVGCMARRREACRAIIVAGESDAPSIPVPDIIRVQRRSWNRIPRLVGGERFLGDVARTIGRNRFLDFWTSSQSVDTAFALALKRPIGEWAVDWQRDFVRPIRLGPSAPLGGLGVAFLVGGLAIAIVTITASRRQVR